jgi:hypothetical protein
MDMLQKIEAMLAEFRKTRAWGTIELQISNGVPTLLRKEVTEKLEVRMGETRHVEQAAIQKSR